MKDYIPVVVFASGLILGYLAGSLGHSVPQYPNVPSNYDPARAAFDDALKQAHDATEQCWKLTIERLRNDSPRTGNPGVNNDPRTQPN